MTIEAEAHYSLDMLLQAQREYLRQGGSGMAAVSKMPPYTYQEYPKWVRDAAGKELGIARDAAEHASLLEQAAEEARRTTTLRPPPYEEPAALAAAAPASAGAEESPPAKGRKA